MNNVAERLRGIVTVLNTPFTQDNRIDITSISKNITYALRAGVSGFLVPAMASEVDKLSRAERVSILEHVVRVVAGAVPIIAGVSSTDTNECIMLMRHALEIQCDAVLAAIRYHTDEQYEQELLTLAAESPPFLMVQDWDFNGYGAPVQLIARLFHSVPCFQSIKIEVVPAGRKYSEMLEATNGNIHVAGGWAVSQMIEALLRGVHTLMPTGMHELYTAIYRYYKTGQYEKAELLFHSLLPVLAFSNQHLDISVHFFKRLLHKQGIYSTPICRDPILPFDTIHAEITETLIQKVQILIQNLHNS